MSRGEVLKDLFNFNSVVANFCRITTSSVFTVTFRALGNCASVFVYRVCAENSVNLMVSHSLISSTLDFMKRCKLIV